MEAAQTTDSDLQRLIEAGELRKAGSALVEGHAGEVFGLCQAMVQDRATAEDLTQDTFSRAFSALPDFRGDASVRTWLLTIARNRCIDHLRSKGREPWRQVDEGPDETADQRPLPAELLSRRRDVERALSNLSEGERALVVLRFGHGLGYRELSTAFGIKEGAVRMRISRALARMRAALEREEAASLRALEVSPTSAAAPSPPSPRSATSLRGRLRQLTSPLKAPSPAKQEALSRWLKKHLAGLPRGFARRLRRQAAAL